MLGKSQTCLEFREWSEDLEKNRKELKVDVLEIDISAFSYSCISFKWMFLQLFQMRIREDFPSETSASL